MGTGRACLCCVCRRIPIRGSLAPPLPAGSCDYLALRLSRPPVWPLVAVAGLMLPRCCCRPTLVVASQCRWRVEGEGSPVSVHLDKARRLAAAGKYKAAVDSLYYAEPGARAGDLIELRGILDVIATVREHADGRIQKNCDEIEKAMQDVLDRESGPAVEIMKQSFASLSGCRVIGGAGLPVQPDANRLWRLCFTDDRVVLFPDYRPQPDEFFDIGWSGLGIEIEGAGAIRRGGGFMGGGFGVE